MIGGPLLFSIVGFTLYTVYENKHGEKAKNSKKVVG